MDVDSLVARMGEDGEETKVDECTEEELLAWTQAVQGYKRRGVWGKGKGGQGENSWDTAPGWGKGGMPQWGSGFTQWESPHGQWGASYHRQKGTPWDNKKGKGSKGSTKSSKGKGKGTQCYSCKGWGTSQPTARRK